ncbi:cation-translocating P-type ATPase [Aestuariivita boseongensis]|uniref:cation-translocating P-type ATPase n=1 Tax=Aestuariivita boseongensis TaxID=1470562 RepID=UPI000680820A|nr:cation-transporting P-type ATPase [Aestuariivita boseongensis]
MCPVGPDNVETQSLSTSGEGLRSADIDGLRERYGWNEMPKGRGVSPLTVLARQFKSFLILILVVAALVAIALGEVVDAIAIGFVLALNAILGFVQEWRAETALKALQAMLKPTAIVLRDGREICIPAREIVPGDIVILETGDTVPADISLTVGTHVTTDESALSGESVPVAKSAGAPNETGRIFAGTAIVTGRAEGRVTAIGSETEFGHVAVLTAAVGEKQTNLQERLKQLAGQIGIAAISISATVILLGVWLGRPAFEMVMTGLSLAVAMVPEGLPAVVTITLALGASAMARRKALVRRLQAIENLGAASVICTDKTGTLTENQMTATRIWTADYTYSVTGSGYDPAGHIARDGQKIRAERDAILGELLETALVCTHASVRREGSHWTMIGAPTEAALVTLAMKGWAPESRADDRLAEVPFTSERKRMSVLAKRADGRVRLHVKGAPETILDRATHIATQYGPRRLEEKERAAIQEAYAEMASGGQRVLALAARDSEPGDLEEIKLVFLGLVGMIDPPRPEVASAIRQARNAGIRVIMVTGDGPLTAGAIAQEVGLDNGEFLCGPDIDSLSDTELQQCLKRAVNFARAKPEHKLRIVRALQSEKHIVAMTGDGVNDAPALKKADIGVAMGIRGTDVSKGAADLILLDDNFATIVNAIREGRRQFDNIRKFVHYLLASNAGEVVAIVANLLIGGPLIFLATQILWMNLITDGVTAVALGLEKTEKNQMEQPPRAPGAPILGWKGILTLAVFGLYTGACSLWIFYTFLPMGVDIARTTAFAGMVVFEKVSVFAFRSLTQPCTQIGWFSNPFLIVAFSVSLLTQVAAVYWSPLQTLLQTVPIGWEQWSLIMIAALPILILPEAFKFLSNRPSSLPAQTTL